MKRVIMAAFAGVVLVTVEPTLARAQTPQQCSSVLLVRNIPANRQTADPCQDLAVMIYELATREAVNIILKPDAVPVGSVFSQRDLQARQSQQPSLSGTPAQGHAIPSVQPAGVAAGTIAMVGTKAGDDAIAALGLNPAILFAGDEVSRQLAQYSRFADLTLFLPVSKLATEVQSRQDSGKIRYFGARLRLNLLGLKAGDQVWDGATSLIAHFISRAGLNVARARQVLSKAPDVVACATALTSPQVPTSLASVKVSCGTAVTFDVDLAEAELLRTELARVRRAADAKYFGADIRMDIGDPTLGAIANSSGRFLFAGLAAGRRISDARQTGTSYGISARLGIRHAKLDSVATAEFAGEGGLGFEIARSVDEQEINASGAVEARYGNSASTVTDKFQTNFVMFRGSFLLPVASSNSVSINVGIPITGGVSPTLSVNFNWGLLLPDTKLR